MLGMQFIILSALSIFERFSVKHNSAPEDREPMPEEPGEVEY